MVVVDGIQAMLLVPDGARLIGGREGLGWLKIKPCGPSIRFASASVRIKVKTAIQMLAE